MAKITNTAKTVEKHFCVNNKVFTAILPVTLDQNGNLFSENTAAADTEHQHKSVRSRQQLQEVSESSSQPIRSRRATSEDLRHSYVITQRRDWSESGPARSQLIRYVQASQWKPSRYVRGPTSHYVIIQDRRDWSESGPATG